MKLDNFAYDLYDAPLSEAIRSVSWLVPMVQSVHIVSITLLVGAALVMELRLAGVLASDVTPGAVVRRHLPWLWGALAMLTLTGTTLLIAEPYRVLTNSVFWWKMMAVAGGLVLTLLLRRPMLRADFDLAGKGWAVLVKPSAWLLIAAWVFAIYCGRWIAYAL